MQTTIGRSVSTRGVGLHTGADVSLRLTSAPPDSGIVFRRTDFQNFEIEAHRKYVSRVVLATTLMKRGVMLSTVEHLMSALYGLGIDNLIVEIDSLEVPILDGSALPFVEMIGRAGIIEQARERRFLKLTREVRCEDGDKFIAITPADEFRISYEIDFAHPAIGVQSLDLSVEPEAYRKELAFARTFGFLHEVEQLRKSNLIRGGSLDNAVVLDEQGIYNGELRKKDEFVRHKVLDLIGDIALCGYPILGHIRAFKAGHALHTALVRQILRSRSCWEEVSEGQLLSI